MTIQTSSQIARSADLRFEQIQTQQKRTYKDFRANAIARNLGKQLWKDYMPTQSMTKVLRKFNRFVRAVERKGKWDVVFL